MEGEEMIWRAYFSICTKKDKKGQNGGKVDRQTLYNRVRT